MGDQQESKGGFEDMIQVEMDKIEMKQTVQICMQIFAKWCQLEQAGRDMTKYDEGIAEEFIPQVLRCRLQAAEVDIVLPDYLMLLIMVCTDGNPAQSLMILSDLLENIHGRIGKIPAGYVITAEDFSYAFSIWPIMEMKSVSDQYSQKWQKQKRKPMFAWETDNSMDMAGWWRKFVE